MKKILVISSNSFSNHANNGKTLSSIFDYWDKSTIAQLYFQNEIPESNKFDNFFRIRDIDIVKKIFFLKKTCGLKIEKKDFVQSHLGGYSLRKIKIIGFLKKFNTFKSFIREVIYGFYFLYKNELESWINAFEPEMIFLVVPNNSFSIKIALRLSKKYNLPISVYFLDDFYVNKKSSLISKIFNYRYLKLLDNLIIQSTSRFTIGEMMSKEYTNLFQKEFDILINPAHIKNDVIKIDYNNLENIKILYAGGLTLGRFEALIQFSKIIRNLKINKEITLIVCSGDNLSNKQKEIISNNNIQFKGKLNFQELDKLYECSHFVLHLESDKEENVRNTYYSVSTKIPECLSKKICLIAYGPQEIASMKLIYENEIGYYIDSRMEYNDAIKKLLFLFLNPEVPMNICQNGYLFANKYFSKNIIASRLFNTLNKIGEEI